jgi:hypothetical protein
MATEDAEKAATQNRVLFNVGVNIGGIKALGSRTVDVTIHFGNGRTRTD